MTLGVTFSSDWHISFSGLRLPCTGNVNSVKRFAKYDPKPRLADLTIQEKLVILHYELKLAKGFFLSETAIAVVRGWITPKEEKDWEYFYR